jgi:hypothetical protein
MSQVLTDGAIDMLHRSLRSGVIAHVPPARFYLVGRLRKENGRASYTTGSQRPLQEGEPIDNTAPQRREPGGPIFFPEL